MILPSLGTQSYFNIVGDGVSRTFLLEFSTDYPFDLFVIRSGQLQINGAGYSFNDSSITFTTPLAAGEVAWVGRSSFVTQLRDWRPFGPFQSDKTEEACDLLITIKQEAAEWRAWVNLSTSTTSSVVTINNTKGNGTDVLLWNDATDVDPARAGMFSAIVNNGILPARNSPDSVEKRVFFSWNGPGTTGPFPAGE